MITMQLLHSSTDLLFQIPPPTELIYTGSHINPFPVYTLSPLILQWSLRTCAEELEVVSGDIE